MKIFTLFAVSAVFLFPLAASVSAVPLEQAVERPIKLGAETKRAYIGRNLESFVDESKKLTIKDIAGGGDGIKFTRNKIGQPTFGITEATVWLRFQVDISESARRGGTGWLLECTRTFISFVTLYSPREGGGFSSQEAGFRSFKQRGELRHRNFLYKLNAKKPSTVYYVKVTSQTPINLPFSIWRRSHFVAQDQWRSYGFGMFFGVIAVMALYNLFLFLSIKDRAYIYYVLYILGYAVFLLGASGYLKSFDILHEKIMESITQFSSLFATFFALKFTKNYLLLDKYVPILHRMIQGAMFFTGVFMFTIFFMPPRITLYAVNIIPIFSIAVLYTSGVICLRRGYRPALFFLIAWSVLVVGLMLYILANLNLIPGSYFSEYGQYLGAALETVLLSLGLGDRINTLKADSEKAQREKLAQERHAREAQQLMAESFSRFVPRQFLNYLGKESVRDIVHGDAVRKDMTVLFTDIRGFTSLSEQKTSEQIFRFLNVYLAQMEPIIQKHGGFIDKFIGDAIMALFPGQAAAAVRSAIEMITVADELSRTSSDPIWRNLKMGIGLHKGELMLGTVGSPDRLDTTVIGDTVNLASRIEGATKIYQTPIIMSDAVYKEAHVNDEFLMRELDSVKVQGKNAPVVLFEAFDADPEVVRGKKKEKLDLHLMALYKFKARDFVYAMEDFQRISDDCPDDHVARIYVDRCKAFIDSPPGDDWRGVSQVWKS